MLELADAQAVPQTQVLIREGVARRRLDQLYLADYYGAIDGFEKVQIKNALEVTLSHDGSDMVLDWNVAGYTVEQLQVQVDLPLDVLN